MIKKVAREHSLHFRLAVIYSDVPQSYLLSRAKNGAVAGTHSLDDGSPLRTEAVEESNVIVGLMGVEPIIDALEDGGRRGAVRTGFGFSGDRRLPRLEGVR